MAVVLMNTAGAIACFIFGALARSAGARRLTIIVMTGFAVAGTWFGLAPVDVTSMLVAATIVGFFMAMSVTAMYGLIPYVFPLAIRNTGVGTAMSLGRVGAALGPYIAGLMMAAGSVRWQYCLALSLPVFFCGIVLRWAVPIAEEADKPKEAPAAAPTEVRQA